VGFAAITLRVASQRMFIVVFRHDSVRKLLDKPSYIKIDYQVYLLTSPVTIIVAVTVLRCISFAFYTAPLDKRGNEVLVTQVAVKRLGRRTGTLL